jgi:hypothetical protein
MSLLCPMTVQSFGGPTEKESISMLLALECVSEGNGVIQPESLRTLVAVSRHLEIVCCWMG